MSWSVINKIRILSPMLTLHSLVVLIAMYIFKSQVCLARARRPTATKVVRKDRHLMDSLTLINPRNEIGDCRRYNHNCILCSAAKTRGFGIDTTPKYTCTCKG